MFTQRRLRWSRCYLALENGVPSHDTFGHMLRLLNSKISKWPFVWANGVVNRLPKYTRTEAAFLRSRGAHRKIYRIVQFQREFNACSAV
nr:hypothetical protein [Trinickia acidisoli]